MAGFQSVQERGDALADRASLGGPEAGLALLRLKTVAKQGSRTPIAVLPVALVLVLVLLGSPAPKHQVLAWAGVWLSVLLGRPFTLSRMQRSLEGGTVDARGIGTRLQQTFFLSLLNGVVTGLGSLLFFPHMDTMSRALVTMVQIGLSGGAVATTGAWPRNFLAYAGAVLGLTAMAWASTLQPDGVAFAVLLLVFGGVQYAAVRDSERLLVESYAMQQENVKLIGALRREKQESEGARTAAEVANLAKSRFLAAASHDLRQPLFALSLNCASLGLRAQDRETQRIVDRLESGIQAMSTLLNSLMDISRLDASLWKPEIGPVDVSLLVGGMADDLLPAAENRGLRLEVECSVGLWVETDAVMLERILRNLADNAVKYSDSGVVTLRVWAKEGRISIEVEDMGQGIPPHEQERIFEPFYQVDNRARDRRKGLGLGLAIVRKLVDLLGMALSLDSTPARGTRVTLTMPQADPPAPGPGGAMDDPRVCEIRPRPRGRILVVDDQADVREGLEELLGLAGFDVLCASNSSDATRMLGTAPVDAVIADFMLADEDGLQAIQTLRRHQPGLPAVIVSGDTSEALMHRTNEAGIPLLHKPVSAADLISALERMISPG